MNNNYKKPYVKPDFWFIDEDWTTLDALRRCIEESNERLNYEKYVETFRKSIEELISDDEDEDVMPNIVDVIFSSPATVVFWDDGTKTVVKAQNGERFDKEKGLAMAICKRLCGNKGNFNDLFKKYCD